MIPRIFNNVTINVENTRDIFYIQMQFLTVTSMSLFSSTIFSSITGPAKTREKGMTFNIRHAACVCRKIYIKLEDEILNSKLHDANNSGMDM